MEFFDAIDAGSNPHFAELCTITFTLWASFMKHEQNKLFCKSFIKPF